MRKICTVFLSAAALALSLLLSGCCAGAAALVADNLLDDEQSKLVLTGTVSLGGVPVQGASVLLTPEEFPGEEGRVYSATTDSKGKYSLSFRWARYRHYELKGVFTAKFDTTDTSDDLTYTYTEAIPPLLFKPLTRDFGLNLQASAPSSSFFVSGVVTRPPLMEGQASDQPADGALITIQPAFSAGENLALFAGRAGPDGSYRISVPWYSGRPYLVNVVYPANAEPAQDEQLETATEWIGPFDTLPLQDDEHNFQLASVAP